MEIYLDNSATTKPYAEVVEEMVKALTTEYGNPSSLHKKGIEVDRKIKEIRQNIARTLGVKDKEIFFTSGGTESNNTIIRGVAYNFRKTKNHIISTTIEHPSVLSTLNDLEKEGFEITLLDVDKSGKINSTFIVDKEYKIRKEHCSLCLFYRILLQKNSNFVLRFFLKSR